jgi:hypothetical protein
MVGGVWCMHQMKKFLLLTMGLPLGAMGIPIDLDRPELDLSAFTSAGYRVEHSAESGPSASFGDWWVSFFSQSGTGFDAISFSGLTAPFGQDSVLLQGETIGGDYYSQIFRLKPEYPDGSGQITIELDDTFSNLAWLRVSGFGPDCDFSIKDVELNSTTSVPEAGPGMLVLALALSGLAIAHAQSRPKLALCPVKKKPSRR